MISGTRNMTLETISTAKCFGGTQGVYRHASSATGTDMVFGLYLPPQAEAAAKLPILYFLSGLTCTHANASEKAGFQRVAAELGLIVVTPDTSPRGPEVPDDPNYDFGQGAGFYVDATQEPFAKNYRMKSYIEDELPNLVEENFPADPKRRSIAGHSMGGHGALTIALRNPDRWRSVSAFAPIVAPSLVPWGEKALGGYLGPDRAAWRRHDAVALIEDGARVPEILVDQGSCDNFLKTQLKPDLLEVACREAGIALTLRMQPGYDHSYYFISTFIEDHLRWHRARLG
jgi:S-formylglutathione hydrolase